MRHRKKTCKLNRTTSHRRCMFANMLKSLVVHGKIETTLPKAKELKSQADRLVTLAKKQTLASQRSAKAKLMIRYNKLTPKEQRSVKQGDQSAYNDDRRAIGILFNDLAERFKERNGGYTRIIKSKHRVGDNAQTCVIEFLTD